MKYNKHYVTAGKLFVFFLRLSASIFHCFFIACIVYNFVILCSLVAFHPGNILDVCEWILFLQGFVSFDTDNDAIILYWHLLHSSLSGGNRFWNSTLGEKYCVSEMTVEVGIFPNFPWLLLVDSFRCAYNRFEAISSFLLAMLLAS